VIKELKNNKAEGIDEIPAEMLKCMGNTAALRVTGERSLQHEKDLCICNFP